MRETFTDKPNDHALTCLPYAVIRYNNSVCEFTPFELIQISHPRRKIKSKTNKFHNMYQN